MLNDQTVIDAADTLARRILDDTTLGAANTRIDRMFELVLNVPPTAAERESIRVFVETTEKRLAGTGTPDPSVRAWSIACQALFSSSRFQFLE